MSELLNIHKITKISSDTVIVMVRLVIELLGAFIFLTDFTSSRNLKPCLLRIPTSIGCINSNITA